MNDPDSRRTIQESIDACRPGTDDANLPEMSALAEKLRDDEQVRGWYDRTQQCDIAIARAFHDVPVPDGLSERLLAALQKDGEEPANESSSSFVDQAVTEQDDLNPTAGVAIPATRPWRWVGAATVGVSVVAILVVSFLRLRPSDPEIVIENQLPDDVQEWIDQAPEWTDWTDWSESLSEAPAEDYPDDAELRADPKQWRFAETRYDSRTIVYDISRPGQKAYVFRIRAKGGTLPFPTAVPATPRWTTGGVAIGAWQRNGMLYVLAVEGGRAEYRKYVGPGMPII